MWQLLIPAITQILDKVLPDPAAAADAKLKMLDMAQRGELAALAAETDLAKGQIATNTAEAASSSLFVSGWRPFVGWTCGLTVAFKYVGGPLLVMATTYFGHPVQLPEIDASELWPVLLGMLGLGGLRSVEKVKGVAR